MITLTVYVVRVQMHAQYQEYTVKPLNKKASKSSQTLYNGQTDKMALNLYKLF